MTLRAVAGGSGGTASADTLTTTMIASLTTTQAATLTSTQAAGLSVAAVAGLTSGQVASTKVSVASSGSPTNSGFQFILQHLWSTGMIDGGAITDNGDGTFNIAASDFMVRQGTNEDDPLVLYRIAAAANIAATANDVTWIYLDYNGGSPQYATTNSMSGFNGIDKVVVCAIGRSATHNHILDLRGVVVDSQRKQRRRDVEWDGYTYRGYWRSSLAPSSLTSSGLNLLVGAGKYYFFNKPLDHDPFDTTVAGTADVNVFTLYYNRTGTWTSVADQKSIDATQYDASGTLTTMTNNKWRCDWVFVIPDSSHQHLVVVLGDAQYNSQAEAQAAPLPSSLPPQIDELSVLVGQVVIQKSAATVTVAQAGGATFTGSAVTDHGALSGLTDDDHPQYQTTTAAATLTSTQMASLTSTAMAATPTAALAGLSTTQVDAMGAVTLSSVQTISGAKDFTGQIYVKEIVEKITFSATAATGTVNFDILTVGQNLRYTTNASANWILNIRGDGSTALNSMIGNNDSIIVTHEVSQGSTAYYATAVKIDGNANGENGYTITIAWQNGAAPTAGNANKKDAYVFQVAKTADKTFAIRASLTMFG